MGCLRVSFSLLNLRLVHRVMTLPGLLSCMDGSEAGLEPTDTGHDSTCALYATQQQLVACANLPVEQPTNQPFNNKGTPQDQNRQ